MLDTLFSESPDRRCLRGDRLRAVELLKIFVAPLLDASFSEPPEDGMCEISEAETVAEELSDCAEFGTAATELSPVGDEDCDGKTRRMCENPSLLQL